MSRYRPCSQTEFLERLGQIPLPLDCSLSERSGPSHNCGRSKARRSRLSPGLLAKYQEMRERRGTEQVSCLGDSAKDENRQEKRKSLLTPSMLTLIVMSNGKRWQRHVLSLPPLTRSPDAQSGQSRAYERRRSPRRLPHDPLGRYRW